METGGADTPNAPALVIPQTLCEIRLGKQRRGQCACMQRESSSAFGRAVKGGEGKGGAGRTRAVSSGRTVHSICRISCWANSAQSGSAVEAGWANEESRKARMFRTRGPLPGSWMMGLERRMSVGSSGGP
jgi:hypothetical protein